MSRFPDYPGEQMIVHSGLKISRIASVIEHRISKIMFFHKVLRGDVDVNSIYRNIEPAVVREALESEKQLLDEILEDIEEGGLLSEVQSIRDEFVCS